jgi:hypothetical protein
MLQRCVKEHPVQNNIETESDYGFFEKYWKRREMLKSLYLMQETLYE